MDEDRIFDAPERDRIYCGGTFDLLHYGHTRLLAEASAYGEVWVSVNDDHFAATYKRKPIMSLAERVEVLQACKHVHRVIVNYGGADSLPAIKMVMPRYIVHGADWQGEHLMKQMGLTPGAMAALQCEFLYLPYTPDISSSEIIKRCTHLPPS